MVHELLGLTQIIVWTQGVTPFRATFSSKVESRDSSKKRSLVEDVSLLWLRGKMMIDNE